VKMTSLPSFVDKVGVTVKVPEIGEVVVDICFGGMWFVVCSLDQIGVELKPENGKKLARIGEMIKVATREQHPVSHPTLNYKGPDILIFTTKPERDGNVVSASNTVVMTNKDLVWGNPDTYSAMLDRSPCGSGTASVMASLFNKGILKVGDIFRHTSIIGLQFEARIADVVEMADGRKSIIPEIHGRAWITAISDQILKEDDPLQNGYMVSDIW